jgi:hypothetical protein
MELDELKNQLKNKLATDHTGRSDADIAVLLHKKTSSVIAKLKRNLLYEIILGVMVVIAFGIIGISSTYQSFRIYFSVFTILCAAFVVFQYYLLRRTTTLSGTALPVKSNLQAIVHIIGEFVKRYFQFSMALVPICFVFALLLGYYEEQPIPKVDLIAKGYFSHRWEIFAFAFIYMVALAVAAYYFTKWYLRKLYGKYVDQLKECIRELGEE